MTNKYSVLVTGATGNQGGAVVQALLPKGHKIRAFTRNVDSPKAKKLVEQGVDVLQGDFSDPKSLVKACEGMDTVYAMSTPYEKGTEYETKHALAIVDAAKQAGVGHLIYSSVSDADKDTGIAHFNSKFVVEKHVISLGIPCTISAPVFFMDNFLSPFWLPGLKDGKLTMAMPADRPLQQISVRSVGSFAASLVERRDQVFGKRFNIASDELTGEESAAVIAKVMGRSVVCESFDPENLREKNGDWADMFVWFDKVGYSADIKKLREDFPEVKWDKLADWASDQDWT